MFDIWSLAAAAEGAELGGTESTCTGSGWAELLAAEVVLPPNPADDADVEEPSGDAQLFGPYGPDAWSVRHFPNEAAAWTARAVPGPHTGQVLATLEMARLSAAGRVDYLVGLNRQIAALRALEHEVLAAMNTRAGESATLIDETGKLWVVEDVRAALRLGG